MDIIINIEHFDNGITLRWRDLNEEENVRAIVIPDHAIDHEVGKIIMEDVFDMMNRSLASKAELTIKIEKDE